MYGLKIYMEYSSTKADVFSIFLWKATFFSSSSCRISGAILPRPTLSPLHLRIQYLSCIIHQIHSTGGLNLQLLALTECLLTGQASNAAPPPSVTAQRGSWSHHSLSLSPSMLSSVVHLPFPSQFLLPTYRMSLINRKEKKCFELSNLLGDPTASMIVAKLSI